jgi:lipopolysaccharide/colanic/teichoic acid biosynthesis glycosyltransferase
MVDKAHQLRFDPKFVKKQEDIRKGSPLMKFVNDPRITPVGRFIRKLSLDELPELFNVFIGKMSIVGPRPHEIEEVAKYENFHKRVLSIKPGMTGMAQVSGRSDLDFDEEVRLDVWYMENWSMKLDIMILFKTPWAVLKKRKAA